MCLMIYTMQQSIRSSVFFLTKTTVNIPRTPHPYGRVNDNCQPEGQLQRDHPYSPYLNLTVYQGQILVSI